MCGIFGYVGPSYSSLYQDFRFLAKISERRGKDSSGVLLYDINSGYKCYKSDQPISSLLRRTPKKSASVSIGHTRLITSGLSENQPLHNNRLVLFHNGIIINEQELWSLTNERRRLTIDTEVLLALALTSLSTTDDLNHLVSHYFSLVRGTVNIALLDVYQGKLLLYTNNHSLYLGTKNNTQFFASEEFSLKSIGCTDIESVDQPTILDVPSHKSIQAFSYKEARSANLIPTLGSSYSESKLLEYQTHELFRCSRCILPATMPFITFDERGVCNYCHAHDKSSRNRNYTSTDFSSLIAPYLTQLSHKSQNCIVPFSGGRDSTYLLHSLVSDYGLKPLTMTYDWGMVTDLARRNISRVCSQLGVENIIIADNIEYKRKLIKKNLLAWLKRPHLGMVNLLMAGDKHFFKYAAQLQKEVGIDLNIWGMNPFEITHFKAGFLGFKPLFNSNQVFYTGVAAQLRYHALRLYQYMRNPAYLNESIPDTLIGEFYRSVRPTKHLINFFDYHPWDEDSVNSVLDIYDWERSLDSVSTWRIGDGTAAFYNYIYYTVAGFSEYDTFRSNQIRKGVLSRELALENIHQENIPRYPNIKWYLDTLSLDFTEVISTINKIPKLYPR